jgi:hypothetical protein
VQPANDPYASASMHDFLIDEPDPLLISETPRHFTPARQGQPSLKVVEGQQSRGASRLRIKDLHPMDLAIVLGIIVIGVLI